MESSPGKPVDPLPLNPTAYFRGTVGHDQPADFGPVAIGQEPFDNEFSMVANVERRKIIFLEEGCGAGGNLWG